MHVSLHNTHRETLEGSRDEQEESNKGWRGIKSIVVRERERKRKGQSKDRVSSAAKQTFNH